MIEHPDPRLTQPVTRNPAIDGERISMCPYESHEWVRDRQGERPLILPSFLEDGRRMVQVACCKCGTVTRMDLDAFEKLNPRA